MRLYPTGAPRPNAHGIRPAYNLLHDYVDFDAQPSPERLSRSADQWMSVGNSGVMARITVLKQGGAVRPVITRGAKHLRFRFVSTKTKTTQVGEGHGEHYLARYNEVATAVRDYEMHPYVIEVASGGKVWEYRPDAVRLLEDGTIELIEVKRTPDDLSCPDYREKLARVAEIARLCGWKFRVIYLAEIVGPPGPNKYDLTQRVRNVDALFGSRTLAITEAENRVAKMMTRQGQPITWAELCGQLAPADELRANAIIEHLLARGKLATNLDLPLGPNTILTAARPLHREAHASIRL